MVRGAELRIPAAKASPSVAWSETERDECEMLKYSIKIGELPVGYCDIAEPFACAIIRQTHGVYWGGGGKTQITPVSRVRLQKYQVDGQTFMYGG